MSNTRPEPSVTIVTARITQLDIRQMPRPVAMLSAEHQEKHRLLLEKGTVESLVSAQALEQFAIDYHRPQYLRKLLKERGLRLGPGDVLSRADDPRTGDMVFTEAWA